ncbi:MAG: RNA-binding S4 domain-containing protein [Limisphaerales bacterium]
MPGPERVRIDKWLWAVRLYQSRSLAIGACHAGHVRIDGQRVKPAREIQVGEVLAARTGQVRRMVKVLGLLEQRVAAKLVGQFLEDQTPPEEYARAREEAARARIRFSQGFGRPTKKQRRQIDERAKR